MAVCLIPMRSGSKRMKDKNICNFFGSPIFIYPLSTARQSGLFSKIIIACDKEYEDLVKRSVPLNTSFNTDTIIYVRDPENSKDESGLIDLVREVVSHFAIADETMCILYSTSVLTTIQQLIECRGKLENYSCSYPVVSKNEGEYNSDSFFMFKIKPILNRKTIIGGYAGISDGFIYIKDYECQDVHTQEDIEDLKKKYRLMQIDKIERQNEYIKRFE